MIAVTNLQSSLQPGRLYIVVTEREVPFPKPGEWEGDFRFVQKLDERFVYRMELVKPWRALDAYVYFYRQIGYTGFEPDFLSKTSPPVMIIDAEGEREFYNSLSKFVDAGNELSRSSFDTWTDLFGALGTAKTFLAVLPWIAGVALIVAAVYFGSRAAK